MKNIISKFNFYKLLPGILFINIFLMVSLILSPSVFAKAVSPDIDPQNGFPTWYSDNNNIQVMPCLDGADPKCVLPAAGEEPNFDPTKPTVFPDNFPSEFFYWIAESDQMTTPKGGKVFMRFAVEGAFENDNPIAEDQVVFGRIRITGTDLEPNSTYVATHPYGRNIYRTDDTGIFPRNTSTTDIGCAPVPGFPCNFSIALVSQVFGGFLKWDTGAPAGYLGDAITPHAVTGSPTGNNFFKIEGPGLPAGGLQTNLFTVSGKLFASEPPCERNIAPEKPELSNPLNGATDVSLSPSVSWNAITNYGINCAGNKNQIQVLLDEGFTNPVTLKGTLQPDQTSLVISNLKPNTLYSWRVFADNGQLLTGSDTFTFTTTSLACANIAPDQPTLVSPASGATNVPTTPSLTWNSVANFGINCTGNNNQIQILLDAGNVIPSTVIGTVNGTQTSFTTSALNFSSTYSWKVRANNGVLSTDSATRTFRTQAPPTRPTAPSFLRGTNITGGVRLTWTDRSNNEVEFRIERRIGLNGIFTQISTVDQNTNVYTDLTNLTGVLSYRVRACNIGGCSAYSNTASIFRR